jgi:hypothetical protein
MTPPSPFSYPNDAPATTYAAAEQQLFTTLITDNVIPASSVCGTSGSQSGCSLADGFRANYGNPAFVGQSQNPQGDNLGGSSGIIAKIGCPTNGSDNLLPFPHEYPSNNPPYTQHQEDELRLQLCNELGEIEQVHTRFFEPMANLLSGMSSNDLFDIYNNENLLQGAINANAQTPGGLNPIALASSVMSVVQNIVSLLPEVGPVAGAGVGLYASALSLGANFWRGDVGGVDSKAIGQSQIAASQIAGWVQSNISEEQETFNQLEAFAYTDPNKLSTMATLTEVGAALNLGGSAPTDDAIQVQQALGSNQYEVEKLVAAATKQNCGFTYKAVTPTYPLSYQAQLNQAAIGGGGFGTEIYPLPANVRSLNVSNSNAQTLVNLFTTDPLTGGDLDQLAGKQLQGYSIPPSRFFMFSTSPANNLCTYPIGNVNDT